MLMASISWWYSSGWRGQADSAGEALTRTIDTFSIGLLLRSLFSPYRQISAGGVRGPLGVQIRAAADRLISRFIGSLLRISLIIAGSVVIAVGVMIGVLRLIAWPLLPLLPIIGILLMLSGWLPWNN